ncbi:hypothetical protein Tco_0006337 [Tanacetum coccineum]
MDLEHNLAKVVPALAPQGQARNLERVGPEERPPRMGPLACRVAQVIPGRVLVTPGSVVVTPGSVVVTTGSVVVTPGSVVWSRGEVAVVYAILKWINGWFGNGSKGSNVKEDGFNPVNTAQRQTSDAIREWKTD